VLVEQKLAATLALANRIYIINNGHISRRTGPGNQDATGNTAALPWRLTAPDRSTQS